MKLYRVFSLFIIFTMMLSYASLPSNVVLASRTQQEGVQKVSKPGFILAQANEDFCQLLSKASNSLEEMIYLAANCPQKELQVVKTADAAEVNAGDPIGFLITITNIGEIDLTHVILRDQLDPEIGWTQNNTQCTINEIGQLYCEFGTLVIGQSISVHISVRSTPAMCGTLTNIAEASADQVIASADDDSIIIHCNPNIVLKKTEENPSIVPGDTARYTLEVKNIGSGTAEGVILTDNLPKSSGLSWTVDSPTGNECQITDFVLTCNLGNLAPDAVRTVVVSTLTTAASCGSDITNDASVSATNENPTDQGDNHDSATITVYCTTLKVEKLADLEVVNANDPIGFKIKVTNTGSSVAKNVVLTDVLPSKVTWSSSPCSIDNGTNTLTCNFGDLAAGESASVHVTGISNAAVCGTMTNTATAKADNLTTESKDSASIVIKCAPKLSVTKTPEKKSVAAGSPVRFTMTIYNTGSAAAENITLTDSLPSNPELTWSYSNVSSGGSCTISARKLTCTYAVLPAGQNASVTVSAVSTFQTCGELVNTVTAQASNFNLVTDIAQINVICGTNISVTKEAERAEIKGGDNSEPARFTITVKNDGATTANGVKLTDPLTSLNGLAWVIDSDSSKSCTISSGVLNCSFGNLAPAQERKIIISSPTIQDRFCRAGVNRTIENYVTVSATNESADDLFDNSDYAKIDVLCAPPVCEAPDEVYSNNFNNGTPGSAFWSSYPIATTPNGTQTFLGDFNNNDLRFTYPDTNPIGHQRIKVSFDLYLIKSWDGNMITYHNHSVGPDHWQFLLLNEAGSLSRNLIDTTFTNYVEPKYQVFRQAYPGKYPAGDFPAGLGASTVQSLGYEFAGPRDSIYHIVYYLPHTETNVKFSFKGFGLQIPSDESWGIDNFELRLMRCSAEPVFQNSIFLPTLLNVNSASSPLLSQDVRIEDK